MNCSTCSGGVGGGTTNSVAGSEERRYLGPPAFLTKTFNIVNDPNTDSVISWSLSGDSFIIWNHHKFSAEILPVYFKHSNLASFVYQLNSYGFRKIGVIHQWEYENPNFQAGKGNLLSNIRRRKRNVCSGTYITISPEIVMNEINESKLEIEKLEHEITAVQEKVENIYKHKLLKKQTRGEVFARKTMIEEIGKEIHARKKRKFISLTTENTEKNHGSENQPVLSTDEYSEVVIDATLEEGSMAKNADDYTFWTKILLEDYEACEAENIVMDFESSIAKVDNQEGERVIIDLN
ncbi:hypothetical protein ABFS82_08G145100 [Erythranthe guttata]|uniref:HSF-type DNA-binding domain-containing protein n=1 Tax=Erythranthe guttata TaxID=4155 RepID=A0A022RWS0_ERYGU|nr:PREDICTED: heat stress transcription factor A-7a-like [Erythranthe guttata]EYU43420.1 hypothetical protein MIMGU_mgv1a020333mg [Erythranthe guttata]|eukprot:XP_012830517.1 PREDICTED: heat stress transcription factor A-7a-like [Erythranthe guttata]